MELRMNQEITALVPQSIEFNYDELKSELGSRLVRYKDMVVTEGDISEAKKDKSSLNKLVIALNDQRIAQQREYMRPFEDYKARVDDLIMMIKSVIAIIDEQLKEFEEARREKKHEVIKQFYLSQIGDFIEILPLHKIWNERWLNVTYKEADIEQEISNTLCRVRNDLGIINAMASPYQQQMVDKYLQTLDMSAALAEKARLEDFQRKLNESLKKSAVPAPPACVQPQTVDHTPHVQTTPAADCDEAQPIDIRIWVTAAQKAALKRFMTENNIRYGSVK